MSPQDFELYSSHETFPDMMAPSHPYLPTSAGFDDGYTAPMSTVEQQQSMNAFAYQFDLDQSNPPRLSTSSESGASVQSTTSSSRGSPHMSAEYQEPWTQMNHGLGLTSGAVLKDFAPDSFVTTGVDFDPIIPADKLPAGCVDPALTFQSPLPYAPPQFQQLPTAASPRFALEHPPSPSPSNTSAPSQSRSDSKRLKSPRAHSPYLGTMSFQPYPQYHGSRRPSESSTHSHHSKTSRRSDSFENDDDSREKGLCPIPECGRTFKDLKAHLLTHQNERPEKCPIQTCEYHTKGFARKYDKNRHTLTHYKGTMVCGFCPGSGSSAEKSFNRADVFKRHLTSVHGVEQTPPNSRRKSPTNKKATGGQQTAPGTCSTCDVTFANAQEFYEHLDDCVLRVVQQTDPAEAINQKLLTSVAEDHEVKDTMERNGLPSTFDMSGPTDFQYDEDDDDDDEDGDDSCTGSKTASSRRTAKPKQDVSKSTKQTRRGLTYSKGGVALSGGAGGRKRRKDYPADWGCSIDRMRMKKRVLCVYDGPRCLWKDDMMLDHEFEVRMRLPLEGKAYVTDLDVQTLKRAEALHGATEEERGPWTPDNIIGLAAGSE